MTRLFLIGSALFALAACSGVNEPATQDEIDDRFGTAETTYVEEHVDFTDAPYDFTGPSSIADLIGVIPDGASVWYGMSESYPISGTCDPRQRNEIETSSALPMEIEGIVTLHPRYFQKINFCGEDERYYGTYMIEDSSGGIMVLKDSRIADFMMGDRIKLKVRGVMKYFDTTAVLVHDPEVIVETEQAVSYKEIDREFDTADIGKVFRITKKVQGEATNTNFNELCLVGLDDSSDEDCSKYCVAHSDCESGECVFPYASATSGTCSRDGGYWLVSLDKEIGQRQPRVIKKGDVLEVTAPVLDSFGLKMIVMRFGQIRVVE